MSGYDGFGYDDLSRLDAIANRTLDDLGDLPIAHSHLEFLIRALSAAAERRSAVTCEVLQAEEDGVASLGNER